MQRQLEFEKVKGWGGKRRGAGRPNKTGLVGHGKRPDVDFRKPLHITLKLKSGLVNLRQPAFADHFCLAVKESKDFGLHIVHFSLLSNHVHLIAEAEDNRGLDRGMKSVTCRLGKFIRKLSGGRGPVWAGRYHLHVLKTPTEMKRALEYVLLNRSKHRNYVEHLDVFSSAPAFSDWRTLLGRRWQGLISDQASVWPTPKDLNLSTPRSWLAARGWKRVAA